MRLFLPILKHENGADIIVGYQILHATPNVEILLPILKHENGADIIVGYQILHATPNVICKS